MAIITEIALGIGVATLIMLGGLIDGGGGRVIRSRISGSFSRTVRMTSRARGAPAVPPPRPPCSMMTTTA